MTDLEYTDVQDTRFILKIISVYARYEIKSYILYNTDTYQTILDNMKILFGDILKVPFTQIMQPILCTVVLKKLSTLAGDIVANVCNLNTKT